MYNHNIPKIEETKSYKINITELKQMSDDELIKFFVDIPAEEYNKQEKAMSEKELEELDDFFDNIMPDHVFNEITRIQEKHIEETEKQTKELREQTKELREQTKELREQNEKSLNALEKMCDSLLDDCRQAINDIHSITNSIDTVIGNSK